MILFPAEECDDMGDGDKARPGAGDDMRLRSDLVSQSEASIVSNQPIRGG